MAMPEKIYVMRINGRICCEETINVGTIDDMATPYVRADLVHDGGNVHTKTPNRVDDVILPPVYPSSFEFIPKEQPAVDLDKLRAEIERIEIIDTTKQGDFDTLGHTSVDLIMEVISFHLEAAGVKHD